MQRTPFFLPALLLPLAAAASAQIGDSDTACIAEPNSTDSPATIELHGSGNAGCPVYGLVKDGPPGLFGYFLTGGVQAPLPVHTGFLCVGGPVFRYNSAAANQVFSFDAGGASRSVVGGGFSYLPTDGSFAPVPAVLAGNTRSFQAWYRDLDPGATSNFSDARTIMFANGIECSGVFPASGGEGTLVEVVADLSAYAGSHGPDDVLFVGEGPGGFTGRVSAIDAEKVWAYVDFIPPFAQEKQVTLKFGSGGVAAIPPYQGVTFEGARYWTGSVGLVSTTLITDATFTPVNESLYVECIEPDYFACAKAELDENGDLRFHLPGSGTCDGDTIYYRMKFELDNGEVIFISLDDSSALAKDDWSLSSFFLQWAIASELASAGYPGQFGLSYSPITGDLVIDYLAGDIADFHPESCIKVIFDPASHSLFTDMAGDDDWIGPDLTDPSPALIAYSDIVGQTQKHYDDPGINKYVIETLRDFGNMLDNGEIRSGKVGVRIRGIASQTYTDSIRVGWNQDLSGPMDWGISLNELDGIDGDSVWSPGEDVYLCLDLSAMPLAAGGTVSLMDRIRDVISPNNNFLDIHIQDDTEVSFSVVQVVRCDP